MQPAISTDISSTEKVIIKPVAENFDADIQLCAINWFNLKRPWLYTLYATLASRYVRKVAGKLCFKGTLIKKLEGPEDAQRENLLIVRYPTPRRFLDLLDFKIFQLLSLLRIAAVEKFCFGFTENILENSYLSGTKDTQFTHQQIYLVHHFQGNASWLKDNRQAVFGAARRHYLSVYFCGLTSARLVREKAGQQQSADFFMDGIVLFAADSEQAIENFIKDDICTAFMLNNNENSLYLFRRTH